MIRFAPYYRQDERLEDIRAGHGRTLAKLSVSAAALLALPESGIETEEDFDNWKSRAVDRIADAAPEVFLEPDSYHADPRPIPTGRYECPLCGQGRLWSTVSGYSWRGLRDHISRHGNSSPCYYMEAAEWVVADRFSEILLRSLRRRVRRAKQVGSPG